MNNITTIHEVNHLLALADQRKIKAPGDDVLARINRLQAVLADGMLKNTITQHAKYVDSKNNEAHSERGFMIAINKRIKKAFGIPASELPSDGQKVLAMCREKIARLIIQKQDQGALRPHIKQDIYREIDRYGSMYQILEIAA